MTLPPQSPRQQRAFKGKASSDTSGSGVAASPRGKRPESVRRKLSATPRSGSISNRKGAAATPKSLRSVQEDSQAESPKEASSAASEPYAGAAAPGMEKDTAEGRKASFIGKGPGHTTASRRLQQVAPFSPALAHWELQNKSDEELLEPAAWDLQASSAIVAS